MGFEIASISLLGLAEVLPAGGLFSEYQSAQEFIRFLLPVPKNVLVLSRIVEDVEPQFDRVARSTFIRNESFVGFPLYPQMFFNCFWVIRVERG